MGAGEITAIISLIIAAVSVASALYANARRHRRENTIDARTGGINMQDLRSDIKYISRGVDDIRVEQRAQREQMSELCERVTRVEESSKQAHKRLDRYDGKVGET